MGTTKFICYCKPPIRVCKSGLMADGTNCFDENYWAEVRSNIEHYLSEDICVPGSSSDEKVHGHFHAMLVEYLDQLATVRALKSPSLEHSSQALARLNRANAAILSYGVDLVSGAISQDDELVALPIPLVGKDDSCLTMARVLAVAAHRSAHELLESISTNNRFYIFHHHAVLYDIAQHMTRLVNEAWDSNSEALLEPDHPHAVSVRAMHENADRQASAAC